jgi:predicted alpha-1,6-mannanase (GH76 family)
MLRVPAGVKPCYVFDGAAPKLKSGEVRNVAWLRSARFNLAALWLQLAKRKARREQAEGELKEAKDNGAHCAAAIVRFVSS